MSESEPMVATFDAFWKRFDEALAELPDAIRADVIDALEPALIECPPPVSHERAVFRDLRAPARRYYAIHHEDLVTLSQASAIAAAIVTTALAAGFAPAPLVPAVASFLAFRMRYRRHRIEITPEQAYVIQRLRPAGPTGLTPAELLDRLDLVERHFVSTVAEIEAVLASLRDVVEANGQPTRLVAEKDGRWRTVDV